MKQKIVFLLFGFILTLALPSCIKDEVTPLSNEGNTIVKFVDGPEQKLFYSPFDDVKEIHIFTFRRDPNSAAALNEAADVVVELAPDMVTDYNDENGTDFEVLPEEIFEFAPESGITRNGDQFTIHFEPGEFSKDMDINLDGSLWDLSKKYAIAFQVVDAGSYQVSGNLASTITFVSIKNKYDGVYTVEGNMVDLLGSRFGRYPKEVELRTLSSDEVVVYDLDDPYEAGYWLYQNGAGDLKLAFGLGFQFDLETDAIVAVTDPWIEAGYDMGLDDNGTNAYDAGTKTIDVIWTAGVDDGTVASWPPKRFTSTETYTFKEDRQ